MDKITHLPSELVNAKKSITFSIEQIRKDPTSNATKIHIDYITLSSDFGLQSYVENKINEKFLYIRLEEDHPISVLRIEMRRFDDGG